MRLVAAGDELAVILDELDMAFRAERADDGPRWTDGRARQRAGL